MLNQPRRDHHGLIVLGLVGLLPLMHGLLHERNQVLARRAGAAVEQLDKPLVAELLAVRGEGFGDSVAGDADHPPGRQLRNCSIVSE